MSYRVDEPRVTFSFLLGLVVGVGMFIVFLTHFPEGTLPYRSGMIGCRLKPKVCDHYYAIYQAEQQVKLLQQSKP